MAFFKSTLFPFLAFAFLLAGTPICLHAQEDEFALFKPAITDLQKEYSAKKEEAMKRYELAKTKVDAHPKEVPTVTIMGGDPATDEFMKGLTKVFEKEGFEVQTGHESDSASVPPPPKSQPVEMTPIDFTSEPMFSNEPQGVQLYPRGKEPVKPPKSSKQEEVLWHSSEVFVSEETIEIEDIKDPVERKKWTEIAEYEAAVFEVNRINLIEAMYIESSDPKGYKKMVATLTEANYSLAETFQLAYKSAPGQQNIIMKEGIVQLAGKILGRE